MKFFKSIGKKTHCCCYCVIFNLIYKFFVFIDHVIISEYSKLNILFMLKGGCFFRKFQIFSYKFVFFGNWRNHPSPNPILPGCHPSNGKRWLSLARRGAATPSYDIGKRCIFSAKNISSDTHRHWMAHGYEKGKSDTQTDFLPSRKPSPSNTPTIRHRSKALLPPHHKPSSSSYPHTPGTRPDGRRASWHHGNRNK